MVLSLHKYKKPADDPIIQSKGTTRFLHRVIKARHRLLGQNENLSALLFPFLSKPATIAAKRVARVQKPEIFSKKSGSFPVSNRFFHSQRRVLHLVAMETT